MIHIENVSTEVKMGETEKQAGKKESGSHGNGKVMRMGRAEYHSAEQGRKQCDCVTY